MMESILQRPINKGGYDRFTINTAPETALWPIFGRVFGAKIAGPNNPFPALVLKQEGPPKLAENILEPTKNLPKPY